MIERLFNDDLCRRLLAGPMGLYLNVLATRPSELGYCDSQSRKLIRTASALGVWLAVRGLNPADAGVDEVRVYMATQKRTPTGRLSEAAIGCSRLPALLRSEGILCKPEPASPADSWLLRFEEYLTNGRGITSSTQTTYRRYIRRFILGLCSDDGPDWSQMTSEYVSGFVLKETSEARAAKGRIVSRVRTFLRFMVSEGHIPAPLVRAIPRVRRWRYAELPKRLSTDELNNVLKACQSDRSTSCRDRAFIALLARLGVRSGELRHLRLEDIDWSQGLLHVKQSKSGRGRTLPLPNDAGALLANYIRRERPPTEYREVFLTSITPRRPMDECTTTTFVKVFLKKLNLDGPGRG